MSEVDPNAVTLTDKAAYKVAELMREEDNLNLKLNISIVGGGCSGFQYHFTFIEKIEPGDMFLEKKVFLKPDTGTTNTSQKKESNEGSEGEQNSADEGGAEVTVGLVINPLSLQYLKGATVDYEETFQGAQFVIHNPNAKTTCGCGSSFST